jgi:tetraacyldisaccharide 4'-kinase
MAQSLNQNSRTLQAAALELIDREPPAPGFVNSLARGVLGGCAAVYCAGLELYLQAERVGLRRRSRLPIPVISIGNLSVGGTGKTPLTQWLVGKLESEGIRCAVLSRGHGARHPGVHVVDPESDEGEGDEPLLLARTLSAPVVVGKDRRQSGREAMRRFGLDAIILDDGFQYWQLARDLDIVLLDAARPFHNGHALPRGLLREPAAHLRRAGVVVVTRSESLPQSDRCSLARRITQLAPESAVAFARHAPAALVAVDGSRSIAGGLEGLRGLPVVALSGIAQPDAFRRSLEGVGARVVRHIVYDDHARYGPSDVERARGAVCESGAKMVVMTEKDAVKWPDRDLRGSLFVALRIEVALEDEQVLMEAVRKVVGPRKP